jgi:hypothetical protein
VYRVTDVVAAAVRARTFEITGICRCFLSREERPSILQLHLLHQRL